MLDKIKTELSIARNMADHPDDEVLRYLIDMAILEVTDKLNITGPVIGDKDESTKEVPPADHHNNKLASIRDDLSTVMNLCLLFYKLDDGLPDVSSLNSQERMHQP